MSEEQTWRACVRGEWLNVTVHRKGAYIVHPTIQGRSLNHDPLWAVAESIRNAGLPPHTQILRPGELTTAEQVEAMRAKCEAACIVWRDSEHQCQEAVDAIEGCVKAIEALKP